MASRPFHQEKKDGSYKWYKKEREEDSMEGRGRSRRHSPQREWKRRLSSVLAVVLTVVMVLNMPLSIDGLGLRISNAFASGNGTGQDSVWATASNAKYKQGDSKDVDIYVIAEDNGVVPGNTSSMTLYLKNNTNQEITEGVLTFKGKYINKEDVTFLDIGAGEIFDTVIAGGGPGTPSQDTAESAEDSAADAAAFPEASGEGLLYQEVQGTEADGNDAALMDDNNDAAPIDDDNDAEAAGDDFDAENGDVEENDEDEEEPWKLEEIDLQPGEFHEIHFEFYTEEDIKSTKANVTFSFRGENEEGSRVESSTKFYYSIGLPTVNFSMEDGMQIESGVSNDLEIWMSEPDWVDEDLEEKLLEQEEKKAEEEMKADEEDTAGGTESGIEPGTASDSEASKGASKASNSNASKNETASDSNADKDNSNTVSQEDEEKIDKYTQEAMEISESRVNYTVEIFGAKFSDFHPRKTVEAEDIGWISCVYEADRNTEPGIYYGKITAAGKWNGKDFTSEQGFLFEITGEGKSGQEFTAELDSMVVYAYAEEGVLPKKVQLIVEELPEGSDAYQGVETILKNEGTFYEGMGMKALDITLMDENGDEIEPDGEVQVSIQMKEGALPEDADIETLEVHHLKEIGDDEIQVEAVADSADKTDGTIRSAEEAAAEFEGAEASQMEMKAVVSENTAAVARFSVDSFSTFTITWGNSNSVTVHYVNQSGTEITGNQTKSVSVKKGEWVSLAQYGTTISGYTYQGAHLNSYNGTSAKRIRYAGDNWEYSNRENGDGSRWRNNSNNGRHVYLVYATSIELTTVETVDSTAEGVHMYMFDYASEAFNGGDYANGDTKEGIASLTVNDNGWPTHTGVDSTPNRGSFSGYFGGSTKADAVNNSYAVNHLFLLDNFEKNGEFYFNSAEYFATLENDDDKDFTVYNQLGTPSGENKYFYQRGNFMPYNTLNLSNILNRNLYDDTGTLLDTTADRYNEALYGFNQTNNFYFGMYVWADFYQPKGGMVEDNEGNDSSPMIFEFTGDDDMWVYIDGVLVLDLGGIHDAQSGSINFVTGEVKWTDTRTGATPNWKNSNLKTIFTNAGRVNSVNWNGNTFADGSNHRIQIFYMERGAGASNLKMRFNLKTIPDGQMSVRKEVKNYYAPQMQNIEYTMQVTVNNQPYANKKYTFFQQEGGGTTDEEGKLKLKYGETALFKELKADDVIKVEEVNVGTLPEGVGVEKAYDISYTVTDGSGQVVGGGSDTENPVTATMPGYGSITFTVTNTATFTRPLKLIKTFNGTENNAVPKDFEATYTLYEVGADDAETRVGSVKYSDLTEVEDGTSASYIFWLETGKKYTIKESFETGDNDGGTTELPWREWTITTNDPAEGTKAENGIVLLDVKDVTDGSEIDTLTITNIYSERTVKVSVDKVVAGNMGNRNETFAFSYTYAKDGINVTNTFSLQDGSPLYVIEIPYGATITVTETGNGAGYTTSYMAKETSTGTDISSGTSTSCSLSDVINDKTIVFTNEKSIQTPTGLNENPYPYLLMLAVAAVGTTSFIFPACRRRRQRGEK